jgi:chorismate mutase
LSENGHRPLVCRGIRGATTPTDNTAAAILEATRELLTQIVEANDGLKPEDIASVFFTTTADLDAEYPALAARQLGWTDVALMCGQEMAVPGALKQCLRVLIHWNTTLRNDEIRHVYLRDAVKLRPDRSQKNYQKQDIPQREDVRG